MVRVSVRVGQGRAEQGRAGQGRAGQGKLRCVCSRVGLLFDMID